MKKITCDHCERDLTYSGGCVEHSLVLSDRHFSGPPGPPVIDVYFVPLLEEDKHFCDFRCLNEWLKK